MAPARSTTSSASYAWAKFPTMPTSPTAACAAPSSTTSAFNPPPFRSASSRPRSRSASPARVPDAPLSSPAFPPAGSETPPPVDSGRWFRCPPKAHGARACACLTCGRAEYLDRPDQKNPSRFFTRAGGSAARRRLGLSVTHLWVHIHDRLGQWGLHGSVQQPLQVNRVDDSLRPVMVVEERIRL